jgi:hypothetical protein
MYSIMVNLTSGEWMRIQQVASGQWSKEALNKPTSKAVVTKMSIPHRDTSSSGLVSVAGNHRNCASRCLYVT